jgi:16S rRNA C1402 N4-methylase RsmH
VGKVSVPSDEEVASNPRSRSAKLRVAELLPTADTDK